MDEDDYGAELDAIAQDTAKQIQQKQEEVKTEDPKPAAPAGGKKSFLQSAIQNANKEGGLSEPKPSAQKDQSDPFAAMGMPPFMAGAGGEEDAPDITQMTNMMQQFMKMTEQLVQENGEGEGEGEGEDEKIKETQKLLNDCVDQIKKEVDDVKPGDEPKEQPQGATPEDPFQNLFAGLNDAMKQNPQGAQPGPGGAGANDPFMNMFQGLMGGMGGMGGMSGMGGAGGPNPGAGPEAKADDAANDQQIDELMKQFTSFLQNPEGGPGAGAEGMGPAGGDDAYKKALSSVVKDILSKDSLYLPMRNLRDHYPGWLEKNWEGLDDGDLEKYNKQSDKVTEICAKFEETYPALKDLGPDGQPKEGAPKIEDDGGEVSEEIFELMSQMQELGRPPESLMKEISEKYGTGPLPGMGQEEDIPGLDELMKGMPPGLNDMMSQLMGGLGGPQGGPPGGNQGGNSGPNTGGEAPKFNNPFEGL